MITDLIVTWPKNCDYPLWRQFIRDNRTRFNEIIIAFMEPNTGVDFSPTIKAAMHQDYVLFTDAPAPKPGQDWRDLAVNASLLHSYNAPWIWFTEQDFYPGVGFWEEVKRLEEEGCQVIAAYQGERMHPCCIFVSRSALNQTRKNFGIVPDKTDHFYLLQKDLEESGVKIGMINPDTYQHYNGLSQNWYLATIGQTPNYHLPEFVDYLSQCLKVSVPIAGKFAEIAHAVINQFVREKRPL